jgi:glycosyltransferase involved in cell wall biosynthesis
MSWRYGIIGWAREAARAAPRAGVWHGHDLTGLPGAIEGLRLNGGVVVYDSHELFVESGSNARRPVWAKWLLRRLERSLSRRAYALVTVNQTLADELDRDYGFRRVVVLHNTPSRWDPPAAPKDRLRAAAGIEPGTPLALYHGGFGADRGLVPLAEAMLAPGLEGCHLVYLGFGELKERLVELAAEPRFGGRIHVLDAVPPDELLAWVASADVGVMPNQPTTANERLSTPNKLFESLAAGIPVVTSDFPERRRIILEDPAGPLGAVCDPTDPLSIGAAIRSIVSLDSAAAADLRRRCLAAAHERWNWETESRRLVDLYADLTGG